MKLFENLKKYFDTTSKEQQDKDWKEVEPLNNIGPDVIDYIGYQLLQRNIDKQKLDELKKLNILYDIKV